MTEDWPQWRKDELAANRHNGVVGQRLLSDTDTHRIWMISLEPGQRLPFHCHVLNYFWTATSVGRSRSRYADGSVADSDCVPGMTRHYRFAEDQSMVHDLENIGTTTLSYVTVEAKIGSANAPLAIAMAPEN